MNDQLSFEEAKRLSIIKWEAIVKNKGSYDERFLNNIPEIRDINAHCGFCERYDSKLGNYHVKCSSCEYGNIAGNCYSSESLFMKYHNESYNRLSNAKKILKVIKQLNENS